MDQSKIRDLVQAGKYEFSQHAEKEREEDQIRVEELEAALKNCEVVEDYPQDRRGASCLVLGFAGSRPIHAVCSIKSDPDELFLITVYDPSRHSWKWMDNYRRRR